MARSFSGSFEWIIAGPGSVATYTAFTMVAVVRRASIATENRVFALHSTSGTSLGLTINGGFVRSTIGASSPVFSITLAESDGWALISVSKAAGTVQPKGHRYLYATDSWVHETHASSVADSPLTTSETYFGRYGISTSSLWVGDLAAVAVFPAELSNAQIESLPFSLAAWSSAGPSGMWVFDQSVTSQRVLDLTGNGANETNRVGTAVSTESVPILGYGADPIHVADIFWDGELANTGGGQADETAVTTVTSAAGGDPWNLVTTATGAEVTYDDVAGNTWHRFSTGVTSGQARAEWTSASITAPMSRCYGGLWFRIPTAALGNSNIYLVRGRGGGAQSFRIRVSTGNKIQLLDSANSSAEQGAHTIAADTDYFLRYDVAVGTSAAGTVELYAADGTLIETLAPTGVNFGSASVDEVGYGVASNISNQSPYLLRGFVSSANAWPDPPASTGVTGTLAATLPSLTSAASAAATVTATTSATLPALTVSATGAGVGGPATAQLPSLTATAAGEVTATATAAVTLPPLSSAATATVARGTVTAILPALTTDADATLTVEADTDAVLPALSPTLVAEATITGTIAATLPSLVVSGAEGTPAPTGTVNATLPALNTASAGEVSFAGTTAATLPALTASATGQATVNATASPTLPSLTADAEGALSNAGMASPSLPPLQATAAGTARIDGTTANTLPPFQADADGAVVADSTLNAVLPALTVSSAAQVTVSGAADATLPALDVDLTAAMAGDGAVLIALPSLTAGAAGVVAVSGDLDALLPALTVDAQAGSTTFIRPARGSIRTRTTTAGLTTRTTTAGLRVI
jgi:hypothetical protein